ncbi:unnamed protein product, partial [Closterium sp. NIES-54]
LTERREPASCPLSPIRTTRRVPRSHPPPVPGTHAMTLRPSSVPLYVPLPTPPESSLHEVPDPESNRARAASPTVTRFLATAVIVTQTFDALVAESAESEPASPPFVGGECALGTDVLEDKQEDFECLGAAIPRFASMLLAPEGDPDAPDIPTLCSYAEAITGPYSSQWQAAMDAEMASWKSTGTYVDEVPPPGANIVDGMWIFRVKRPTGSPPAFKARYVARGFSQGQGGDYFQTFSPTPKMTTLEVLLHVAAQRDYELHSLDFSTAFLQGSLHKEIWLRRPPGFTGSFPAGTPWSLRRPVYNLCQAPREWHDTQRTTLAALGEEKMQEEGDACDRWIEKSVVLYDLILQSVNNDMLQHIKDLVELDDSGPKAWKLLCDVIQPNTLPMVIVLEKELAALSMRPGDDVKRDQWTPEWLRQQILQEDFRRRHTGGGAANKTAEGYGATGGSRGKGEGRGRGRGRGFSKGRGRGDYNEGHGSSGGKESTRMEGACGYCKKAGHPWFKCFSQPEGWAPPGMKPPSGDRARGGAMQGSGAQGDGAQGKANPGMFLMVEDVKGSEGDVGSVGKVVMHPLTHWVIDSGCTSHMTPRADLLDKVKPPGKIKFVAAASCALLPVIGVGNAKLMGANGGLVGLGNVLLVEGLSANLLSVRRLQKSKAKVTFGPTNCRAKLGKLLLWDLEEKSSCFKDLWQLPIISWNGKPPATAAAAATAKTTARGEETAPTDGALDAVKKVQQSNGPTGDWRSGITGLPEAHLRTTGTASNMKATSTQPPSTTAPPIHTPPYYTP